MKFSWRMIFDDFKKTYPALWRRGTVFQPHDFMTILVTIPGVGKYTYEYYHKRLITIEEFEDEEAKRWDRIEEYERRVEDFKVDIPRIMEERDLTQQDVSELTGISRVSINQYLSGKKTPKLSTIEKIYKGLRLD